MAEWHELAKLALRPRYAFCVWVTSLLILLVPLPEFLQIGKIQQDYGTYIGIGAVFAFIVWAVEIVIFGGERVGEKLATRKKKRDILDNLDSLSSDELFLLARALFLGIQTVSWRTDHDEVSSLVAKGLLEKVPHESTYGSKPYTIPRFVWTHLLRHKTAIIERAKALSPDKGKSLE